MIAISKCGLCNVLIVCFSDRLGVSRSPVKSEIGSNISKLQSASSQYPDERTLQKLVIADKAARKQRDTKGPSAALLGYYRCLLKRNQHEIQR
jgi:hypothetical protein